MLCLDLSHRVYAVLAAFLFAVVIQPEVCAAAASGSRYSRRDNDTSTCRQTKVAILGAGISGIITAQVLSNHSITDFLIVEYQDRIGGRVFHGNFGTRPDGKPWVIEYGANWISGIGGKKINPILALESKWNISSVPQEDDSILTYTEAGPVNYTDELAAFQDAMDIVSAQSGELLKDNIQDRSLRESAALAGWKPEQRKDPAIARAAEWIGWDYEAAIEMERSSTIYNMAASNYTYDEYGKGDNLVIDQRGHDYYIRAEASTFLSPNDTRLLLNTVVENIKYGTDGVLVTNKDGSCIKADYAVTTFSLGVLQHEGAITFEPELPDWKKIAIEKFNVGTYTKIFLQFPYTFWPNETHLFLYADPHRRGYYPVWQSLDTKGFLEGSHVLFVTVTHEESRRVERLTDEQTQAECLAVLRLMFPDIDIPDPLAILYPRWNQIPWAYGSYSNWPYGTTLEQHQNLRANVDRLWFTGEYASATRFAFMHGAYLEARETGLRIAGLIKGTCVGNQDQGECGERIHYDVLHGTSPYSDYNPENGWIGSSFAPETDKRDDL